jgi:hypothetical protein
MSLQRRAKPLARAVVGGELIEELSVESIAPFARSTRDARKVTV